MNGLRRSSFALGINVYSTKHYVISTQHIMAIDKEFESKLMRLRHLRRMSQSELAAAIGVSRLTVTYWETGRTEPNLTIRQVKALVKTLGITLDELPDDFGPQRIESKN
jgi:DNA-binding XRE family transcriptional regulator